MVDLEGARRRAGSVLVDAFFKSASSVGKLHPLSRPERHGIEVIRNIAYGEHREHHLDVYRPKDRGEKLPALLYVHGGGFRILSKDTHWVMALAFARRGFVVFNVGYRLAPAHPFPAAVEDVSRAFEWVADHGAEYGADPRRLVLAGESAGANLVTGLTLSTLYERDEPFARRVYDRDIVPEAVVPACGIFQVTDPHRFSRRKASFPRFLMDRMEEVERAYLGGRDADDHPLIDYVDPLVWLERRQEPTRALPPFFLPVGTKDPLLDDTRRMARALRALGAVAEDEYYEGEVHAFHAFVMRKAAQRCWADTFRFLDEHVPR